MNCHTILSALTLVTVLGTTRPAASDSPPAKDNAVEQRLSNTRTANCIVKIRWNSQTLSLDAEILNALMSIDYVQGRAIRDVLGLSPEGVLKTGLGVAVPQVAISLNPLSMPSDPFGGGDRSSLFMELHVKIGANADHIKPAAQELMRDICRRLDAMLNRLWREQMNSLRSTSEAVEAEYERVRQRLQQSLDEQKELRLKVGDVDLRKHRLLDRIHELRAQQREMELERLVQEARREATERQIAAITDRVRTRSQSDPVVTELQKVVDLRVAALDRLRKLVAKQIASTVELAAAELEVATAKAHLAERQQSAVFAFDNELVANLNGEITRLTIDLEAAGVRQHYLEDRLKRARELLPVAEQLELRAALELPVLQATLEELTRKRIEFERRLRMKRKPTLWIVGAE